MPPARRVGIRGRRELMACLAGCVLSAAIGLHPAPTLAGPDPCEIGTALAQSGNVALAESVFVSLLSRSPRDPRALNNLGNLALIRGRPRVALAFYDDAASRDTSDAGIVLNQATALMLLGDENEAQLTASSGVAKAGGVGAAAGLLGITAPSELDPNDPPKAGQATSVHREEMLMLLRIAAGKVPADSIRATGAQKVHPKPPVIRSAGPRGDADTGSPAVVYWKR